MNTPGVKKVRHQGRAVVQVASVIAMLRERGLYDIVRDIASRHHLTIEMVLDSSRSPLRVKARRSLYAYFRVMGFSFTEIGEVFGRDHTTVMAELRAGVRKVDDRLTVSDAKWGERKESEPSWSADEAAIVILESIVPAEPAMMVAAADPDEGDW